MNLYTAYTLYSYITKTEELRHSNHYMNSKACHLTYRGIEFRESNHSCVQRDQPQDDLHEGGL